MVRRIASFGVVCFLWSAACVAVCQSATQSLPDAPSAQSEKAAPMVNGFAKVRPLPALVESSIRYTELIRQTEFASAMRSQPAQEKSNTIFDKYLSPSTPKRQASSDSSSDGGFMTRATHAATSIFFTRDPSGKDRLNTAYFLRALTYAAAGTASRPYWRRSPGEPLSDFGSTVGNDAGMKVLHEFEPGLQHMMKSHAPRFVARIAEGIGRK